MLKVRFLLVSFVILSLNNLIQGWRPYQIQKLNVTADSLSNEIAMNASLTESNGLSIYINVKETLRQPFVRLEFFVESANGVLDMEYLNKTIDVCRFFRDKKYLPFIQLLYQLYVKAGNYPTSSPIKKKLYLSENVQENVEEFPPVLPLKQFSIGYVIYSKDGLNLKPLASFKIFQKIVKI